MDQAHDDLEHLRDEKDQEIEILNAGMDDTLKKLDEAQQVCEEFHSRIHLLIVI